MQHDRRSSEAGFTLVEVMLVVFIIGFAFSFQMPFLQEARRDTNELNAIGDLKAIHSSQQLFYEGDLDKDGLKDYAGNLKELDESGALKFVLQADGTSLRRGYIVSIRDGGPNNEEWVADAEPGVPGRTGDRFFGVTQEGVIRFTREGPVSTFGGRPIGGGTNQ